MRGLCLVLSLSLAIPASASFELLLVTDLANNVVHRVDGDSGTYLGTFGRNILSFPTGIAINQATQTAFVTSNSGLSAFNYNTGEHLWTNPDVTRAVDLALRANGDLIGGVSGMAVPLGLYWFPSPATTTTTPWFTGPMAVYRGAAVDSNDFFYAADASNNRVVRWHPSTSNVFNAVSANGSFSGIGALAARGTELLGVSSTGALTLVNTLSMTAGSASSAAAGSWTSAADVAFGHGGTAWAVGRAGTTTRFQAYARSNSSFGYRTIGGGFAMSQIGEASGLAVVVAPEPGTMTALGLGALALLRRRRKQK